MDKFKLIYLLHHYGCGLSRQEAAKKLDLSPKTISNLLSQAKKEYPQLFPILTKQEYQVYRYWLKNIPRQDMATILNCSIKKVDNILKQLHKKGYKPSFHVNKVLAYETWMDNDVTETF